MPSVKSLCVGALLCASLNAHAVIIIGNGSQSCGTWTEAHDNQQQQNIRALAQDVWLYGYLSGIAHESNKDILSRTDGDALSSWVSNYCHANPLNQIAVAAMTLADVLNSRR